MKWFLVLLVGIYSHSANAQLTDTIFLWPGKMPLQEEEKTYAEVSENRSGNVTRISKVTNPLLTPFYPQEKKHNLCMLICPGGAYKYLTIDKEGSEIALWLTDHGITAFVLQYRVPDNRTGALQDVQRALRFIRHRYPDFRIGIMGFSAGGSLTARISTMSDREHYPPADEKDSLSARPDFAALIYPAYLDEGENRNLTPELVIDQKTPPMFLFGTADDLYGNSTLVMAAALRDHKIPFELHVLPSGGHGYGLREGNTAAKTWPNLLLNWIIGTQLNN